MKALAVCLNLADAVSIIGFLSLRGKYCMELAVIGHLIRRCIDLDPSAILLLVLSVSRFGYLHKGRASMELSSYTGLR